MEISHLRISEHTYILLNVCVTSSTCIYVYLWSLEIKPITLKVQKFKKKLARMKKMREEIMAGESCSRALGARKKPQS